MPLTKYERISSKEIEKCKKVESYPYSIYQSILETITTIQDCLQLSEGIFLKKDLCLDFLEDVSRNVWLIGIYSREFEEFLMASK